MMDGTSTSQEVATLDPAQTSSSTEAVLERLDASNSSEVLPYMASASSLRSSWFVPPSPSVRVDTALISRAQNTLRAFTDSANSHDMVHEVNSSLRRRYVPEADVDHDLISRAQASLRTLSDAADRFDRIAITQSSSRDHFTDEPFVTPTPASVTMGTAMVPPESQERQLQTAPTAPPLARVHSPMGWPEDISSPASTPKGRTEVPESLSPSLQMQKVCKRLSSRCMLAARCSHVRG